MTVTAGAGRASAPYTSGSRDAPRPSSEVRVRSGFPPPAGLAPIALALVLAACSPSEPEAGGAGVRWLPDPGPVSRTRPEGRKEWGPIPLPDMRHAWPDAPAEVPRITLNLLSNGDLLFKGNVWPHGVAHATTEERARCLRNLRSELEHLTGFRPQLLDEGGSRVPVMLHADRGVGWLDVRDVLSLLPDLSPRSTTSRSRSAPGHRKATGGWRPSWCAGRGAGQRFRRTPRP